MADLIARGIDDSTGQNKPLTSSDTLVDSSGNRVGAATTQEVSLDQGTTTTITIAANTLTADNQNLSFDYWGTSGDSANTVLTVSWAGSTVLTSNSIASGNTVYVRGNIIRSGASTAETSAMINGTSGVSDGASFTAVSTTWSNGNDLVFTWAGGMNEEGNAIVRIWTS